MEIQIIGSDVRWIKDGKSYGFGYVGENGRIGLIKCPECERENYAMNVSSGMCTWCPFNASDLQPAPRHDTIDEAK